jgi:hypothetical protein
MIKISEQALSIGRADELAIKCVMLGVVIASDSFSRREASLTPLRVVQKVGVVAKFLMSSNAVLQTALARISLFEFALSVSCLAFRGAVLGSVATHFIILHYPSL